MRESFTGIRISELSLRAAVMLAVGGLLAFVGNHFFLSVNIRKAIAAIFSLSGWLLAVICTT